MKRTSDKERARRIRVIRDGLRRERTLEQIGKVLGFSHEMVRKIALAAGITDRGYFLRGARHRRLREAGKLCRMCLEPPARRRKFCEAHLRERYLRLCLYRSRHPEVHARQERDRRARVKAARHRA